MYETFQKFLRGDTSVEMETIDGAPFDKESWTSLTPEGESIIKHHEDVAFTGHSFGGATGVSLSF
jgi:platelet-activating factor acetylhydrolase